MTASGRDHGPSACRYFSANAWVGLSRHGTRPDSAYLPKRFKAFACSPTVLPAYPFADIQSRYSSTAREKSVASALAYLRGGLGKRPEIRPLRTASPWKASSDSAASTNATPRQPMVGSTALKFLPQRKQPARFVPAFVDVKNSSRTGQRNRNRPSSSNLQGTPSS